MDVIEYLKDAANIYRQNWEELRGSDAGLYHYGAARACEVAIMVIENSRNSDAEAARQLAEIFRDGELAGEPDPDFEEVDTAELKRLLNNISRTREYLESLRKEASDLADECGVDSLNGAEAAGRSGGLRDALLYFPDNAGNAGVPFIFGFDAAEDCPSDAAETYDEHLGRKMFEAFYAEQDVKFPFEDCLQVTRESWIKAAKEMKNTIYSPDYGRSAFRAFCAAAENGNEENYDLINERFKRHWNNAAQAVRMAL